MGDAESVAETLSQLHTLVKKVDTTMGAMQKAFQSLEKRVSRLEVQGRKSVPIEVEEELAPNEKDEQKRMVFLKTGTKALRCLFWLGAKPSQKTPSFELVSLTCVVF